MEAFRSKFYPFSILALALALASSCGNSENSTGEGIQVAEAPEGAREIFLTEVQFNTMKMEWGSPKKENFSTEINVQGTVKVPVEGMQEISAYFGGYVSDLKLIEGQPVRKGETLFYLENPDFIRLQQDYLETSSQLTYLKAEFERQRTLSAEQISAQKNFLKAEADYQSSLAKCQGLKKQLSLININAEDLTPETIRSKVPVYSPIKGFVEDVFVVPGQFLPASGKAVSLLNKDHLHIELILFEKDAPQIHIGQKVAFAMPDNPEREIMAEIHVVGQSVNAQRQINVHADLEDEKEGLGLFPGMFVQARIQLDPKQSWSLPEDALVELAGEYYILLQKEKTDLGYKLERIRVIPGGKSRGNIAIEALTALDENSVILVKGGFNLL
ncbi:membrane fusion protein, cobalt-zinc-cadmium efflux system [Algoriphagus alkaliphilus]|uniref:Membrane fusion protein, cobalt-zinc-cadmium efflux system n=1 Tax=Algoriphagus alkaliphilus TaxID=279824 RepID=A0A1G5YK56_9BACT|nr:efflux RND transporter periplasmic adaptor subunit [Algoriphagus alkaliphilus]MBA4298728.1 efflux RND transporter periplasmic adaptor subunit [Cyclobacterium sp.]SDA83208.1 membrane fusion protein, cobalt-zinc-cadmium efflux system [Algoriphagus alkaliphilus]